MPSPTVNAKLVDTRALLDFCLLEVSSPLVTKLAIDLEGVNLCRNGRVCLFQITSDLSKTVWVVDITTLGRVAFDHVGPYQQSLKQVLQNTRTTKMFYDVRSDADALYNHYGITVENVCDIQLLEIAVRKSKGFRTRLLTGLSRVIQEYIQPGSEWLRVKEAGGALLFPDKGGSYEVCERRPLDQRILLYAAQDVSLLFQLETALRGRLPRTGNWNARVAKASRDRVLESHLSYYETDRNIRRMAPPL